MQGYNCIMIFDKDKKHVLCCKRLWDPYEGKFNLVGGKIDEGEDGFTLHTKSFMKKRESKMRM